MLYRIRKQGTGVQLFSTGGERPEWKVNGKIWLSLSAFASHLSLQTLNKDKMLRAPASLFKLYGDCTVIELDSNGIGAPNEVPFKVWYDKYFETSEKFRAARKAEKSALTKTPDPVKPVTKSMTDAERLTAQPVVVNKPKGWDIPTTNSVTTVLDRAAKLVRGMEFKGIHSHPKTGDSFAVIEIDGKKFAMLSL